MSACHKVNVESTSVDQRPSIASIMRHHRDAYRGRFAISNSAQKVLNAVTRCRTAALGGHLAACTQCQTQTPLYNSCRDRHCPTCQGSKQAIWLAKREATILPTHYFHVVFTLPQALRELVRQNPRLLLGRLMNLAADTLTTLGRDPRHLGAQLGVTTVLHTWTRALNYHPHVHCIVTGGGVSLDGERWVATKPRFLVAARVMRALFRGRFLAALRKDYETDRLRLEGSLEAWRDPDVFRRVERQLYRQKWVIYAKPPFGGPAAVFRYLGRYTHRVGISNARIVRADAREVTFITRQSATVTVEPLEFMRRFFLHVLPKGFVKIRHYGLLAGRRVKQSLPRARELAERLDRSDGGKKDGASETPAQTSPDRAAILTTGSWQQRLFLLTGTDPELCPTCGQRTIQRCPLPRDNTS